MSLGFLCLCIMYLALNSQKWNVTQREKQGILHLLHNESSFQTHLWKLWNWPETRRWHDKLTSAILYMDLCPFFFFLSRTLRSSDFLCLPVCLRSPGRFPGNELFPQRSVPSASPWEGRPVPWWKWRAPLLSATHKHRGQHFNLQCSFNKI